MRIYIILSILVLSITVTSKAQTWELCSNRLEDEEIKALLVMDRQILVGTRDGDVFLSEDNGTKWIQTGSHFSTVCTFKIIGDKIYAGTGYQGVYLSKDKGKTWTSQNDSLPYRVISGIVSVDDCIFACCLFPKAGGGGGRIIKSSDEGKTWTEVLAGKNQNWLNQIDVIDNNIYIGTSLGQILVSKDLGLNWSKVTPGLPDMIIQILKSRDNQLLVGTDEGEFLISQNLGLSWEKKNNGLPDDYISAIESNGTNLFVGTKVNGIFHSSDNGSSWLDYSDTLFNKSVQYNCLKTNSDYIFCGLGNLRGMYRKKLPTVNILESSKNNNTYKLYPNPTRDYLNVTPSEEQAISASNKIEILTALGIIVWQSNAFKGKIDISNLQIGVYFLRIGDKFYKFEKV